MKKILFFLALFFLSTALFSQRKYNDYELSHQYLFFSKIFTKGQKEDAWYKSAEGMLDIAMEEGYWKLTNTKFRAWGIGDNIEPDTTKDFQIDVGVKFISGGDNHKQES